MKKSDFGKERQCEGIGVKNEVPGSPRARSFAHDRFTSTPRIASGAGMIGLAKSLFVEAMVLARQLMKSLR